MKLNPSQIFPPHREEQDASLVTDSFSRLLAISFKAQGVERQQPQLFNVLWPAQAFQLQHTQVWRALTTEQQVSILSHLSRGILIEAAAIETSGMGYAAKMNLLAETHEEKSFFSLMGAEESRHYRQLEPWFPPHENQPPPHSFAALIGQIVAEGDRQSNLALIQVLLEGWGLSYYSELGATCLDRNLGGIFQSIVEDETRHHAAGVLLCENIKPEGRLSSFAEQALMEILFAVRIGPANSISALQAQGIEFSKDQAHELLNEMMAVETTQQKLDRVFRLLAKVIPTGHLDRWTEQGLFRPLSVKEMASTLFQASPRPPEANSGP